ncbi:MAG TPA: hypothetical protein VFE11_00085 [Dongiaceae bacterium]|jgi:hypothetical protein|nr:hypothetical protein [Dongiaceae bacterium]
MIGTNRLPIAVALSAAGMAPAFLARAQETQPPPPGPPMGPGMMHGGMMWGMGILWILTVIVLLLGAAALIKYLFFSARR